MYYRESNKPNIIVKDLNSNPVFYADPCNEHHWYNDDRRTGAASKGRKATAADTEPKTGRPKAAAKSRIEVDIERLKNTLDCKLEGLKNKELSALTKSISKIKGKKGKDFHVELEALLIPVKKLLHAPTTAWTKNKEETLEARKAKKIEDLNAQLNNKATDTELNDAIRFTDSAFPSYREPNTGIAIAGALSIIAMMSFANTFMTIGIHNYTAYPIAFVLSLSMAVIFFSFGGKYRYREPAFRLKKFRGIPISTLILIPGLGSIVSIIGIVSYTFTSSPDHFNIWSFLMTFLALCAGIFVTGYFLTPPSDLTGNIKRIKSIESDKDRLREKIDALDLINPTDEHRVYEANERRAHDIKYIEYTAPIETLLKDFHNEVEILKNKAIEHFRPNAKDLANYIKISELSARPEGRFIEDDDPQIEETVTSCREASIKAFNEAVKERIDAELDSTGIRVAFDKTISNAFEGIRKKL